MDKFKGGPWRLRGGASAGPLVIGSALKKDAKYVGGAMVESKRTGIFRYGNKDGCQLQAGKFLVPAYEVKMTTHFSHSLNEI